VGKAGIYVLLLIVAVIVIGAIVYGLLWALGILSAKAHARHLVHLRETTPWTHYTDVGEHGEYILGIIRRAEGHTFDGPLELHRLPIDHDQTEVRIKLDAVKARVLMENEQHVAPH
jgi:hypothetical protein